MKLLFIASLLLIATSVFADSKIDPPSEQGRAGKMVQCIMDNLRPEVTPEEVKEDIKGDAEKVAGTVYEKINDTTEAISDKVLSYQIKPNLNKNKKQVKKAEEENSGAMVLGAATKVKSNPAVISVYNQLVHFAAGLIKYWQWTIGGILALILVLKLTGGGRKRRRRR